MNFKAKTNKKKWLSTKNVWQQLQFAGHGTQQHGGTPLLRRLRFTIQLPAINEMPHCSNSSRETNVDSIRCRTKFIIRLFIPAIDIVDQTSFYPVQHEHCLNCTLAVMVRQPHAKQRTKSKMSHCSSVCQSVCPISGVHSKFEFPRRASSNTRPLTDWGQLWRIRIRDLCHVVQITPRANSDNSNCWANGQSANDI